MGHFIGILLFYLLWPSPQRLDIELGTLLLALQQHIDLIGTPLLTFERAMVPELGLLLGQQNQLLLLLGDPPLGTLFL